MTFFVHSSSILRTFDRPIWFSLCLYFLLLKGPVLSKSLFCPLFVDTSYFWKTVPFHPVFVNTSSSCFSKAGFFDGDIFSSIFCQYFSPLTRVANFDNFLLILFTFDQSTEQKEIKVKAAGHIIIISPLFFWGGLLPFFFRKKHF